MQADLPKSTAVTCNPRVASHTALCPSRHPRSSAHRALATDISAGLLLPCNVVIRADEGRTFVEALDPQTMVTVTGEPSLQPVAEAAASKLRAALAALPAAPQP